MFYETMWELLTPLHISAVEWYVRQQSERNAEHVLEMVYEDNLMRKN